MPHPRFVSRGSPAVHESGGARFFPHVPPGADIAPAGFSPTAGPERRERERADPGAVSHEQKPRCIARLVQLG